MTVKRETVRARTLVVAPIRLYQRLISPALPPRCKYYPTCSAYAVDAVRELGILRGMIVAAWRLLRCNPFSHGGYDPIENRSIFPLESSAPARPHSHHRSSCGLAHASGSSGSAQGAMEVRSRA